MKKVLSSNHRSDGIFRLLTSCGRGSSWKSFEKAVSHSLATIRMLNPNSGSEELYLFGAQGQLDHPLEQLFRRQTSEVAHNELLGV